MRSLPILLILGCVPAATAQPRDVRTSLAALEKILNGAVARVAPPSPMAMLAGPGGSRGYHLRGRGAFFVLPPRRLPGRAPHVLMLQAHPRTHQQGPEGERLAERVAALHEEAERMNREAERAYRRVRRDIYVRFGEAPQAEGDPAEAMADDASAAAEPEARPAPPWHFWFESDSGPAPVAGTDELVAEVRGALTAALDSDVPPLPMLGPDEFLAVAVDFVSDPFFMSGGEHARTLVLRVRHGDLQARRQGRLSPAQFQERVVYEEY